MLARARKFAKNENASVTVEFVVVFIGVVAMMMFVIESTLYSFFMASLEKAAEAGVRAAVVSRPVTNSFTTTMPADEGVRGQDCEDGDTCGTINTVTCTGRTGAGCNIPRLQRLVNHMRSFNGAITRQNVTVVYDEVGIGFAGGPNVPMVTVRVDRVAFQTGIFALLLQNVPGGLGTLPARAATMTAEDLAGD